MLVWKKVITGFLSDWYQVIELVHRLTPYKHVGPRVSSLNGIKRQKVLLFLAFFVKEGHMSELQLSSALTTVLYLQP